jgi:glycerol-3-phosphate O-acyltransferase
MNFLENLRESRENNRIPEKIFVICTQLYHSYKASIEADGLRMEDYESVFSFLLKSVEEQLAHPYSFEPYHQKITSPIDYFKFSLDFTHPLVNLRESVLLHKENVTKIISQLKKGENVILFANHQTEVDPQLINILLEDLGFTFGRDMIFVAGDRVLTDPMATPFSMGCNLLCIYSKRYIDTPPEQRANKQLHNQRTMQLLRQLLTEGGKCVYVAPAGGRDRPNEKGEVEVAEFDPQSIEMFRLMALKAKTATHFYPLALATYDILPPPQTIQRELGEKRVTKRSKVLLSFGNEIDMEGILTGDDQDRHETRQQRSDAIVAMVKEQYKLLKNL